MAKILPIWWAWQWRVIVAVLLANLAFGLLIGFFGALLGLSQQSLTIIANIFSFVVTIYASIYFLDYALHKKYGRFWIVIIEETDNIYKKAAIK